MQRGHSLLGCILENNARGQSIRVQILRNSGLKTEADRHMDVLYSTVERAARKLKADDLEEQLAALLKMDRTTAAKGEQGNACMVAALVLTVAVLVQTRLEAGKGLHNIDVAPLAKIGTSPKPAEEMERAFNRILQHDYAPVFTIARDILFDVTQAGRKTAMLDEAIAGIIEQSRDAAEQYAAAGADYAGELFKPHHARPGVRWCVLHAPGGRRATGRSGAPRDRRDGIHRCQGRQAVARTRPHMRQRNADCRRG